jgi:hypothetical protein
MAKIGTRGLKTPSREPAVTATLHYFQGKYAADSEFFMELPEGRYELASGKVQQLRPPRTTNKILFGFKGETEYQAKEAAEQYLQWYSENEVKREKLIFIEVGNSRQSGSNSYANRLREDLTQSAKVEFEFTVLLRTEIEGKARYEVDQELNDGRYTNGNFYDTKVNNGVLIPYSELAMEGCKAMVQELHKISDRINILLGTPEQALAILEGPIAKALTAATSTTEA